jgi:hypothetical protein
MPIRSNFKMTIFLCIIFGFPAALFFLISAGLFAYTIIVRTDQGGAFWADPHHMVLHIFGLKIGFDGSRLNLLIISLFSVLALGALYLFVKHVKLHL